VALSELEAARVRKAVGGFVASLNAAGHRRTFARSSISVFRVSGHSVELFEVRPVWRGAPGEKQEQPFAKATYVRTRGRWRVFCSVGISSGTVMSQRRKLRQSRSSLLWFTRTDMRVSLAEPTPNNRWRGP